MVKIILRNYKDDLENLSITGNNPESFEMESPFEESSEATFGSHLVKYLQKHGLTTFQYKILKGRLTKQDIKSFNRLYNYYERQKEHVKENDNKVVKSKNLYGIIYQPEDD